MTERASLLPASKTRLLRQLLRGGATTSQLAAHCHLHPTVVRRHLVDLVRAGLVESTALSARRGRPAALYRLTKNGREMFYARYDVVLDSVARALPRHRRPTSARQVFRDAGQSLAERLGGPRPDSEVVAVLQELGFEPELTRKHGQCLLLSRNCPILEVARTHPELACEEFHGSLLGGLRAGSRGRLQQSISRGAPHCVHRLDPPNPPAAAGPN